MLKNLNSKIEQCFIWFVLKYLPFPVGYTCMCYHIQQQYRLKRKFLTWILFSLVIINIRLIIHALSFYIPISSISKFNYLFEFFKNDQTDNTIPIFTYIIIVSLVLYFAYKLYDKKQKNLFLWRPAFDLFIRNIDQFVLSYSSYYPYEQVMQNDFKANIAGNNTEIYYMINKLPLEALNQFVFLVFKWVQYDGVRFKHRLTLYPYAFNKIRIQLIYKWVLIEFIASFILFICGMLYLC